MPRGYDPLPQYPVKTVCEACLTPYKIYNMKWNKKHIKCIVNDTRSIVFYIKDGQPVRLLYKDIKRIEMRRWMKIVLVLHNKEIVLSGYRRKSMFNHIKQCFIEQINYSQ